MSLRNLYSKWKGTLLTTSGIAAAGVYYYHVYVPRKRQERIITASSTEQHAALQWRPPTRASLLKDLAEHNSTERELDLLIIGGGATGTGCAVDGAVRGLKVACVEREDWASGTSSKSTKLVHGGVRYLEKAIKNFDMDQYKLVEEALAERSTVLRIAPHLAGQLPIMLPIYKWYMIPYFWVGSKMYDLIAGGAGLENSYFLNRTKALEAFPMLRQEGLAGAMVYYDGMQNDARMNVTLALTAMYHGAIVTNYTKVVDLIKEADKETGEIKVKGAIIEDTLTGKQFPVRAKGVINATGPFCDAIRKMDDPKVENIVSPSTGTHIILPNYFSPRNMGLIDPSSSDGRVIFFLPWEGNVISGTTDSPSEVTFEPKAGENEIEFILGEIDGYLNPEVFVRRSDVLAAWAGLRPLVRDPNAKDTASLVRNHLIHVSPAGVLTIAGGKWTTYRNMAKETIDRAIQEYGLKPKNPQADTSQTMLIGAHGYSDLLYLKLIQRYGLETDVAQHLSRDYGDRAMLVAEYCPDSNQRWPLHGNRLNHLYPYDEAEVIYACRHEFAETVVDVLARRTRLAFLSCQAAYEAIPEVLTIMAKEKNWSKEEIERQRLHAERFLKTMGLDEVFSHRAQFSKEEVTKLRQIFQDLDKSHNDLVLTSSLLPKLRELVPENRDWSGILERIDPDRMGRVNFGDFMEAIAVARQRVEQAKKK